MRTFHKTTIWFLKLGALLRRSVTQLTKINSSVLLMAMACNSAGKLHVSRTRKLNQMNLKAILLTFTVLFVVAGEDRTHLETPSKVAINVMQQCERVFCSWAA